jgi:hypothetical protein
MNPFNYLGMSENSTIIILGYVKTKNLNLALTHLLLSEDVVNLVDNKLVTASST